MYLPTMHRKFSSKGNNLLHLLLSLFIWLLLQTTWVVYGINSVRKKCGFNMFVYLSEKNPKQLGWLVHERHN